MNPIKPTKPTATTASHGKPPVGAGDGTAPGKAADELIELDCVCVLCFGHDPQRLADGCIVVFGTDRADLIRGKNDDRPGSNPIQQFSRQSVGPDIGRLGQCHEMEIWIGGHQCLHLVDRNGSALGYEVVAGQEFIADLVDGLTDGRDRHG